MKKIIFAAVLLIPSLSFGFTTLKFKEFSTATRGAGVTCDFVSTSDDKGVTDAGTNQYFNPGTVTSRNLRGVTKIYSSAYYTPTANDKFVKMICYPTATGPTSTKSNVKMYIDNASTPYTVNESFMLKCH